MTSILTTLMLAVQVAGQPVDDGQSGPPKPFAFTRSIVVGAVSYTADFARIDLPEDRAKPDGAKVQIALCRLRAKVDAPGPPLFYLPGLPDSAARTGNDDDWAPLWDRALQYGDVVLMDPRGIGQSRPQLVYDGPDYKPWLLFADEETAKRHMMDTAAAARRHWEQQAVDLSAYNDGRMSDDIEAVRVALGYERIRILGHSAGTHLAMCYLRNHADRVERFICVGPAGPGDIMKPPSESDASFARIADLARSTASGGDPSIDLEKTMRDALASLHQKPLTVSVIDPRTDETVTVQLGDFGLRLLVIQDLADEKDLPQLPRLLQSVIRRDDSLVTPMLQKRVNGFARLPLPLFTSRAAASATPQRWRQIDREAPQSIFGRVRTLFCPELAAALGVNELPAIFRDPLHCEVPTLFISGTLDAHTPPAQAERIRAGFSNSVHITFENAGHDLILMDGEARDDMIRFLSAETLSDKRVTKPAIRFLSS